MELGLLTKKLKNGEGPILYTKRVKGQQRNKGKGGGQRGGGAGE